MSILTIRFAIFLSVAIVLYYLTPAAHQWKSLLLISCGFYLVSGPENLIFLLTTALSTYYAGIRIGRINDEYEEKLAQCREAGTKLTRAEKQALKAEEDRRKRVIMALTLALNFGILFVLKYSDTLHFLLASLCSLFRIPYRVPAFSWMIPMGISYYTFQSMGYIIDLYRRKYLPERNVFRLMLFVSFFPQLIQGPISRFDELGKTLYQPHEFAFRNIKYGVELMAWGMFKKLVISDRIAIMTNTVFGAPERYRGMYLAAATVLSMLQLYTDFSGGIDMVRGAGELFGITLAENFTRPFFAVNLGEYWRRWHITLNNWWRDYIFYPLTLSKVFTGFGKKAKKLVGDNFGKKLPILLSVIIIRVINSIWHGATVTSILGGIYYGLLLALSFYFEPYFKLANEKLRINTECFSWKLYQCVRTFVLIAAPRLVSRASTMRESAVYMKCLVSTYNPWILFDGSLYNLGVSQKQFLVLMISLVLLLVVSAIQERGIVVREALDRQNVVFRIAFYCIFIYAIVLFGVYGQGYDASSFTYAQF